MQNCISIEWLWLMHMELCTTDFSYGSYQVKPSKAWAKRIGIFRVLTWNDLLAWHGGVCLKSQLWGRLRQEDCLSPEVQSNIERPVSVFKREIKRGKEEGGKKKLFKVGGHSNSFFHIFRITSSLQMFLLCLFDYFLLIKWHFNS